MRVPVPRSRSLPSTAGRAAAILLLAAAGARAAPVHAQQAPRLVATVEGLRAPEAVRYDPALDVYFVSNWNDGPPSGLDNNGFISRVRPDGTVDQLRFVAGGANGATLHAPRGLAVVGDTLWAVDADALRGFDRRTGAPLATVSFAGRELGFLNDVAPGPDGALYVTDTGKDVVYRVAGGQVAVAVADSALGDPNGIAWDAAGRRFLVAPFGGARGLRAWRPADARAGVGAGRATLAPAGESSGAQYDGLEVLADGAARGGGPLRRVLVASQADSSLHLFAGAGDGPLAGRPIVRLAGRPADIGVDTRRQRVAVPYVARNVVEIWQLPRE